MPHPTRRAAISGIGAVAASAGLTLAAVAAPPGHPVRVGILGIVAPGFDPATIPVHKALVDGLRELGYQPGRDVFFEYRSALGGGPPALARAAAELLAAKVDILVAPGTEPSLQAAKATKTVPIVMVGAGDAAETGLIGSLAHPGGNVTGLSVNKAEAAAKRLQLLKEAVAGLSRVAVLWNASIQSMTLGFENIERASPQLGVTIQSVRVTGSDQFDRAFAALDAGHPQGLIVLFGPLRGDDLPRIVAFSVSHRLPTIFELGQGVRGGGLMEFGPNLVQLSRRAAVYIDKIANGADPAGIPVEEPTAFELVINLQAAKQMGLALPSTLLIRADRVVE